MKNNKMEITNLIGNYLKEFDLNLLGVSPLDYSSAELKALCEELAAAGFEKVNPIAMDAGFEVFQNAARAKTSLVVSMSGLPAARLLKSRYGIPYYVGAPVDKASAGAIARGIAEAAEEVQPMPKGEGGVLVIGEAVLAKTIARRLSEICSMPAVAGIVGSHDREVLPEVPYVILDTEEKIRRELSKGYDIIVGDPLYKLIMPKNSTARFIERPHRAQSGRLYPPTEKTIAEVMGEV